MIRLFTPEDTETVIDLWLQSSIQAHPFIPRMYWEQQTEVMRTVYLPLSDEIVLHIDDVSGELTSFMAFTGEFLAALFVAPLWQGKGLGSRLFRIAQRMHPGFSLSVYSGNTRAVEFYLRHGMQVCGERVEQSTGQRELIMEFPQTSEKMDINV
jgi:putative acetyltransferase